MQDAAVTTGESGNKKWKVAFILCFLALVVDGADVMLLSLSLSSIKADFGLSTVEVGMLGSVTILGMGLGGIFGGWCSDKFGRVKAISVSVFVFSVLTGLLSITENVYQFAALRFLSGVGLGTVYIVCAGLIAEYVPTKYRTTTIATLQTGWTFGYILASVMAGAIIPDFGWRMVFLVSTVSVVLAFLIYYFVPESESWKLAQKNKDKQIVNTKVKPQSSFGILFKDKAVLKILIFWIIASSLLHVGYNGANHWMPIYVEQELGLNFKSMTTYMIASYTAMIFGKVFAGILADKVGRRFSFMFGSISTAIILMLIVFYHSPTNIFYFLIAFGFFYGIPFGVYSTYMSESFPTHIRGTALGTAHNVGRLGSTLAPTLIGMIAAGYSIGYGFFVLGLAYLVCVIPLFFVREKLYDPQSASKDVDTTNSVGEAKSLNQASTNKAL